MLCPFRLLLWSMDYLKVCLIRIVLYVPIALLSLCFCVQCNPIMVREHDLYDLNSYIFSKIVFWPRLLSVWVNFLYSSLVIFCALRSIVPNFHSHYSFLLIWSEKKIFFLTLNLSISLQLSEFLACSIYCGHFKISSLYDNIYI